MARTPKPTGRNKNRQRSDASFRRDFGERTTAPSVLIVCEGEKTEPLYFEDLRRRFRLSAVQVKIVGAGAAPISVVNYARSERARHNYDIVWCAFDRESVHENNTFAQAVAAASALEYRLAISNPAFEYWYLLHFDDTTRPFANASEIIEELQNHLPGYKKSWREFSLLFARLDEAALRAAKVLALRQQETAESYPCPSTCVHELVAELRSMQPVR
jgi:hypothetical protein